MPARWSVVAGVVLAISVAGIPAWYGPTREGQYRNFRAVEDGTLYRSGQLSPDVFERVVREYGIRTVISLRDSYGEGTPPDQAEADFCARGGLKHFRISPAAWSTPEGTVPAAEGVKEFVRLMERRDELKPILVHCFAGLHRTGAQVAIYRIHFQGWPANDAITEMMGIQPRRAGFKPDLLDYVRTYSPQK